MVDLAWKILLHDKLRFAITVAGVGFAVMLVFVQVGLFEGLMANATLTIERADADLWVTAVRTPNIDFANSFPETLVSRVRSVPGVQRADNLIVTFANVTLPSGVRENAVVYGLEHFDRWNLPWKIADGDPRELRRGKFVVLDRSAVRRFGAFDVGEFREFFGQRLKIIGTTHEAKSFTTNPVAFMDYRVAQSLQPDDLTNRTTYILVKLRPGADAQTAKAEIQRRLPYNTVLTREEWAQQSRSYWIESTGLGLNMYMTVFLGALVGVVVVAQTLYTSAMEHIREFATVKAIGGSNADIYAILAKQAAISAVLGFAVGASMALAVAPAMQKVDLQLILTLRFAAAVFLATVALCIAASALSFRQVARLDPALVFRG